MTWSQDWITPKSLVDMLGPFDLDPCACRTQPWPTANRMIRPPEDGLSLPWRGLIWLNPPYGGFAQRWLRKLAYHDDGGVALLFARTGSPWFQDLVFGTAMAVVFLAGRIYFHRPDGSRAPHNSGGDLVLVAYGIEATERIKRVKGFYMKLDRIIADAPLLAQREGA